MARDSKGDLHHPPPAYTGPLVDLGLVPDFLVVDAVRYALGRMTYQVEETTRWVVSMWERFPRPLRNQIRKDVEWQFNMDDQARAQGRREHLPLGMDCDRASWERVRALWKEADNG